MTAEESIKHTVKDSVFTKLVSQKGAPREVYLALHPDEQDVTDAECVPVTLERILTNREYNDFGMLVRGKLLVMLEAQSTFTKNIAVRFLMYLASEYRRYIVEQELSPYSDTTIALPKPELYMIYSGDEEVPETLYLSDLFLEGKGDVELRVNVLRGGGNDIISQYVKFCRITDEQRRLYGKTMKAIQETLKICREQGVLAAFLEARREEVTTVMSMLFNEEELRELEARAAARERREAIEAATKAATEAATKAATEAANEKRNHLFAQLIARMEPLGRIGELAAAAADNAKLIRLAKEFGVDV